MKAGNFAASILSMLFVIACLAGLLWQLYLVANIYFSYKVTTKLKVAFPEILKPQSTSFCARNTDLLQYERLNEATGRNWSYTQDEEVVHMMQQQLTVGEIFSLTPAADEVMEKVVFRRPKTYERFDVVGHDVYRSFHADKFVYLEYVCYRLWDKGARSMTYRALAVTPTSPGVVYEVHLNETMRRSNVLTVCLHGRGNYPYRSLKTCPRMLRLYNESDSQSNFRYNYYVNYQVRLTVQLMKPPFETMCLDYKHETGGMDSDEHCVQSCLKNRTTAKYGMLPFGIIVDDDMMREAPDRRLMS